MQESFAPSTVMPGRGDVRGVQYGDDANFVVRFYMREVEDAEQTKLKGRVILKAVPYCEKKCVGDPRTIWDNPISEVDKQRFPQQYAAFEKGEEESVIGTPLEAWPLLTSDMRVLLKNNGFKTVEQLTGITDSTLSMMPGNVGILIQRVKAHAEKFIKDQEAGEQERRLEGMVQERDNEIGAMRSQMEAMAQQLERMRETQLAASIPSAMSAAPSMPQAPKVEPKIDPEAMAADALSTLPELPAVESVEASEPPKKRGPGRPRKSEAA